MICRVGLVTKLFLLFCFFQVLFDTFPDNGIRFHFTACATTADLELIKERVIRAIIVHYPPSVIIEKQADGGFKYSGTSIDQLEYIAKALHLNIKYVHASEQVLKKVGLASLQSQALLNDQADVAPIGGVATHQKYQETDFSVPKLIDEFILAVPWPKEESRLLAPIRPFQPLVWLVLGIAFIVMVPFLAFISGLHLRHIRGLILRRRNLNSFGGILHNGSFLLSQLTNQGYHYNLHLRSRGSYIAVGVWCLMAVVLANAYAGTLFSFFSVTKLQAPINSLDDLAKSKDVTLIIQNYLLLTDELLNAKNGTEKIIGDTLRANPENLVSNVKEAGKKLTNGTHAFTHIKLFVNGVIDSIYRGNGKKCLLTIAKETIPLFSPPNIDQCKMENQKSSAQAKPLSLIDMSSAFVVLALGISLAVLVFLLETIYKHIKDRYSNLTENKPCGKLRIKSGKKVGEPKVGVKIVALEANNVIAVKPNVEVEAVSVQATGGR